MRGPASVALVALAVTVASAPPSPAQTGAPSDVTAAALARLAAGDTSRAYRAVRDADRRGEADAAALRLRLRLELAGYGVGGLPRFLRHQQIVEVARSLRERAPADTLALRVLLDDAVWTVLDWHDRVLLTPVQIPGRGAPIDGGSGRIDRGAVVSQAEIDGRLARSRFDPEAREAISPDVDASGPARGAREDALGLAEAWLAADAAAPQAYRGALTLAVLDGAWDDALALARRFQAASDDARADLYAGLALYRLGRAADAEAAFDHALARLSPEARARIEDVRPLLPDSAQAAYAADSEAAAQAFWSQADPRLLTPENERRAEHVARVVEADLLFGMRDEDLFTTTPRRGAETEQGRIWVRYGRPARAVRFRTSDNSIQMYGERDDVTFAAWEYDDFRFVFDDPDRDGAFRTYSPPARAFATSQTAAYDDYVAQDRRMRRDDPERTQVAPVVALDVPLLVSRFRAPGGGTDVVVGFGVPLVSDAVPPVSTGAFALADGAVVSRVVETRRQLASGRVVRAGGGPVWAEAAHVRLPGAGAVRVEVEAAEGAAWGTATERVEPLAGGFGVSDLLLATSVDDEGRGPVVRDGLGIVPAPRAAFPTTDPVYVVLEAYGLGLENGRTRYTVEAALRPEARRGGLLGRLFGRGQGPGVSVRTEATGTRADDLVSFFVDVRDQAPGRYTLTVTVADATTGRTASATREVVLE